MPCRAPACRLETLEQAVDQVHAGYRRRAARAPPIWSAPRPQLVAGVTYRRDSQFALATAYGQALAIGLTVDDVNEWPDRIRAVTADAVRKAAANGLDPREAVTAYLEPGAAQ